MRDGRPTTSRPRLDHGDVVHAVHDETRFEERVLHAHATDASADEYRGVDNVRTLRVVRAAFLLLLGLYGVWAPMLKVTAVQVWTLYGIGLAVGVILLACRNWSRPALPLLLLLIANWGVLWATHPIWSAWDDSHTRAVQEAYAMRSCALNSTAVALLAGTGRFGPRALRRLWSVIALTLLVMATGEVITRTHFSPFGPYAPPSFSPAGPFGNPNNLACVLVVILGIVLGRMSERITTTRRVALGATAALTLILLGLTLSRAALLGAVAVTLAAALLAINRTAWGRRALRPRRMRTWFKTTLIGLATLSITGGAALLWHLVTPSDADQVRSDGLRLTLIRIALGYWREHPWFGVGGGRFDMLLRDEHPDVGYVLPVHNTFVEYLTEYGLVGAASLFVLLALATIITLRPHRRTGVSGRPHSLDDDGTRYLAFVFLVGIVLAAVVMSSALNWQAWWLMIASLAVTAGHLRERRDPGVRRLRGRSV